jgi:3-hydroxyacyl-CoA dehydrogenase / 3-hydroxy-2-methylbutyryl-CoA dehydrogenase
MDIEGSGALVVGGASGLGEATARRLHQHGAELTIADINAEKGEALAAELGAEFAACDVREEDQVQAAVEQAASAEGGLRICVCCAGTGIAIKVAGSKGPHPLEPFATILAINLIGTFNVLRFAAAAMLDTEPLEDGERGVCINTASVAAYDGQIGQVAYSASKGGVVGMTLPAARDLADARESLGKSIPFPPRLGQPAEYAALAAHIVENRMLNGEVIRLDGALRMAPR